jgi:hypothetical protein
MNTKLTDELNSFQELWEGGFFVGDPLDPLGRSAYDPIGFISVLHATYLRCIKPYLNRDSISLELGPGRGAWTKALLPSKEVYALDALPEEHNGFYDYLGHPVNVKYFQVTDFTCSMLPDNHFDYMFSYDCLCHVSFEGISEYAVNLLPKLKRGSNCFWMVADYDKYNSAIDHQYELSIWNAVMPTSKRKLPLKQFLTFLMKRKRLRGIPADEDDAPRPGRWYNAGIERTTSMLTKVGYQVVDKDVGTCPKSPIVHFVKP